LNRQQKYDILFFFNKFNTSQMGNFMSWTGLSRERNI